MLDLILILDFSINPVAPKATDLDVRTVKAFATALLEHLDIGEDKTRVGVVVYGQEATTVLHLTGSADAIQNSISTAALAGEVKWGNSMSLALVEAVWGLVNDSRPLDTTGRTAVVVNVHPTTDSPKQHRAAEELASSNNITLYTVGIGSLTDSEALRHITQNDSSRVFLAANTSAALGLIEDLVKALQAESVPQICACRGPPGEKGEPGLVGPKGDTGAKGGQGEKGNVGEKGSAGRNGHKGAPGAPGEPGPKGEKGKVGEKGASGTPGERGLPGVDGTPGERGLPGVDGTPGERGLPGVNGTPGERGLPGVNGTPGERGLPGVNGTPGERGLPGVNGTPGEHGLPGVNGTNGEKGGYGEKGEQGVIGPRGPSGLNGSRGATGGVGPKGQKGERGSTGATGDQGEKGNVGEKGASGTPGEHGAPGVNGTPGEHGLPGVNGTPGERGLPGVNGTNGEKGGYGEKGEQGVIGPIGPSGLKGSRGATGGVGPKGQKGERGSTGATGYGQKGQKGERGSTGTPGADGTPGQRGYTGSPGQNYIGGSVYYHWGQSTCPSGAEKVYDGYITGPRGYPSSSYYPANHLCLPRQPQYASYSLTPRIGDIKLGKLAYYVANNSPFMYCALCRTTRPTTVMIPATDVCPSGWTREYHGYLAAGLRNGASNFICFDHTGTLPDPEIYSDLVRIYTHCSGFWRLTCPPYREDKVLMCVVCSK